jgi:hypothetical protein
MKKADSQKQMVTVIGVAGHPPVFVAEHFGTGVWDVGAATARAGEMPAE